jgi:hypothetical protein
MQHLLQQWKMYLRYIVFANLKNPKADGIACPKLAGYNDHIKVKEKGCLCSA